MGNKYTITERFIYADLLRCIAAFMVVIIHTTSNVYNQFTPSWNIYLYVNSLTSIAVPCFFLLSGAFLLNKEESIWFFLENRILRIVIPLTFWSVIYIIFRAFFLKENLSIINSLVNIFITPQYWHLWFMYSITAIYFITPILRIMYKNSDKVHMAYMLILFLIFPVCLLTIEVLIGKWMSPSRVFWYFPEIGYFLVGALLTTRPYTFFQKNRKWIVILAVFSYLSVVFFSYYISMRAGTPKKDFINYDKLFVLLFSVSVFCLVYSYEETLRRFSNTVKMIIRSISEVSLGIYLIHPLVMGVIGNISIFGIKFTNNAGSIWNMLLGAIIYFTLSFILCYGISKIPRIKRIVA